MRTVHVCRSVSPSVLALASALLSSLPLAAAFAQTPAQTEVPGVQVTDGGNRVIYSAAYFSQFNVTTANDQLQRVPGLQNLSGGGGGQRGFGSGGDQILINGQRVSGKSNGVGSLLQRLQARQVVQIEVIRGAVPGLDVRSQGRVVNVVLEDTLSTGYGALAAGVEHYSEGSPGASAELSYNGDLGALNYVVSLEGDVRRSQSQALDRFYTPNHVLFAQQAESARGQSDELGFSANTRYTFLNGNTLNFNALLTEEDESDQEVSTDYAIAGAQAVLIDGRRSAETEAARDWEIGGDYQHLFANGHTLQTLFIHSSSRTSEEGMFFELPVGALPLLDDVQREHSVSEESILRSSYQWSLGTDHLLESGAEVAINTVDDEAVLLAPGAGGSALIPVFTEGSTLKETRYEMFTSYSWQAAPRLLLEAALELEFSELTQRGAGVQRSRNFFYPRPRLALRYDLDEQRQLRGRIERTISQLDFGAFVASFTNDDNRFDVINAGNPELEPEQTWEYEIAYEQQLSNDRGVLEISAEYADVSEHIGRIPLLVNTSTGPRLRTAPGNLGDGYSAELEVSASLRLDTLGLSGAVLDVRADWQKSRVTDPFTGMSREFNFTADHSWSLAYRQDLDWQALSYGIETRRQSEAALYDLDYYQRMRSEPDLELFVEMQPFPNTTLRLEAESLLRAQSRRERFEYAGNRGNTPLERRELRSTRQAREVSLSISWAF